MLVLEVLDEMGCKPCVISGTSIGAIIGALYASGLSGKDIKERIRRYSVSKIDTWRDVLKKRSDLLQWVKAFEFERGRGGLVRADRFLKFLFAEIHNTTFEDLNIPLTVIAADYWGAEEVILTTGKLLPAIKASMAVPGVFAPMLIAGRVLVDGGIVNLVPYDHIMDRCDVSIAVNVAKARTPGKRKVPGVLESILSTFEVMQAATLVGKMRRRQPDIYIHPEIRGVSTFDFGKAEAVFRQAEPAMDKLRKALAKKLAE